MTTATIPGRAAGFAAPARTTTATRTTKTTRKNGNGRQTRAILLAGAFLLSATGAAMAQAGGGGGDPAGKTPLLIQSQGSFFVGGERKYYPYTAAADSPYLPPAVFGSGHVTVNQMYVQYQVPVKTGGRPELRVPLVMVHGAAHSGATYESTPDGREGWKTYFVRQGHPVYVVDQVTRARSGFDASSLIMAKRNGDVGLVPNVVTFSQESAWTAFRFGPAYGTPYAGVQFPIGSVGQYFRQLVPDFAAPLGPDDSLNVAGLGHVLRKTGPAVVMTHSQSGLYGWDTALKNPSWVKGVVTVEPRTCQVGADHLAVLARIPVLVVFGDHVEESPDWNPILNGCQALVNQLNARGGDATLLHLPKAGIYGNTHMLMLDRNNLQVAGLVDDWVEAHVAKARP